MEAVGSGSSYPIGASIEPDGINFCVYARDATQVDLLLFDDVNDGVPARTIPLDVRVNRTYKYWHVFVPGVTSGQIYAYRARRTVPAAPGATL